MQPDKFYSAHHPTPAGPARSAAIAEWVQNEIDQAPLIGDEAGNPSIDYTDQGSRQQRAMRLWLQAEAEVMAERNPFVFTLS